MRAFFSTAKLWARVFSLVIATFSAPELVAQTTTYIQGSLRVNVFVSNPCNGSSNGFIRFSVLQTSDGQPGILQLILPATGGNPNFFGPQSISVGSSFVFNVPLTLPADSYDFVIRDTPNVDIINTFGPPPPVTLTSLPNLVINQNTLTNNSSCASPDGQVVGSISGGSQALPGGGSYTYTWTSSNGLAGLPLTNNNFNGLSNLNLATLLSIPGLPGGTYTLNVTDNFSSCSQSRNFIITDPSPSLFSITSGSGTACSGANFTVTLNGTDSAPTNYEILRNGAPTGLIFPGTGGGSFNMTFATIGFTNGDVLTVRATNGFCTPRLMTGSVVLNIASSPTSATLNGTTTICAGQSTNISVAIVGGTAPFSFTITGLGPVAGYAPGAPISVSPLTTSIYTLSGLVTDANGCTVAGSGNAAVTVNPTPTAVVSALPGTLCTGSSSTLTFNLTGSGPFNVGYSDGFTTFNLSGIPNGHTVVVTPVITSTYTITSITDATGCIGLPGSATTITVNPAPVSALLTGTATICAGQSTNLIVTIAGGTPNYGFTITGLGPIGAYTSGSAISVSPAVTMTYTLAGLVTDANGCTVAGSGSALVTVNPLPTATISSLPGSLCTGGSSTLTFTLTGTGPFTVGYSDGSTTFTLPGISTGHTVVVNPVVTTTYTITSVSDATSCVGVGGSSTTVTVNPSPTAANLSGAAAICAGQSTNLSVAITGGVAPFSFTLTGFGAVTGYTSGSPIAVSPLATTTFSIAGLVTDANGCTVAGSGSALVTVNPLPTATISSLPGSLCTGGSSTLTFTLTGTGPFTVGYSDGSTTFTLPGISTGHTVVVNPVVTTTYTITSVSDATSCVGVGGSSTTVTVNPSPTAANLSGAAAICAGQSTNLSVAITGGVAPFSFTLTGFGAVTGYTSGSPIAVSPLATTTFSIAGLVTDANGCTVAGSGSALVTVNAVPASPGPGIDTWVGDVYSDAGNVASPYENGVDFSVAKYRGFIVESDFTSFGTSTYNSATDAFDLDLSNNIPLAAATICGSYLNNYSIRFRNTRTFASGIYTFNFSSDDGVRFFIDNVAVPLTRVLVTSPANSFTNHSYLGYSSSPICLTGTHDLRIEYFENAGFSRLTADATFQPLTSPTVTTPVSVCVGGTAPTLTATTVDANATGFNWYSSTNVLLFTGASFTPNGAQLNLAVAGATTFNVASIYSCGDGPTTPVVVNVINGISTALAVGATIDPVCIGGSSAITVDLSEAGVSYQLRTGVTPIGSAVIG
ncbi:MAG: hypothetical protein HOP37_07775, partial [Cyclobacteriaceae bacterium]|nr:hypothetical protein [Cyclobacteriaceae bacterium]